MTVTIPSDFPRDPHPASIPGAAEKFSARKIDGRYVVGLTDDELMERYTVCVDLVSQLVLYCQRKELEDPKRTPHSILERTGKGLESQSIEWGLSPLENRWIMDKVVAELGWKDI